MFPPQKNREEIVHTVFGNDVSDAEKFSLSSSKIVLTSTTVDVTTGCFLISGLDVLKKKM